MAVPSLPKIAATTAVFALLANTDANAAGETFCNGYAGTSVEQFNRAQELGLSVSGPRWHGGFDVHNLWCRFVSEAAAQHEIDQRQAVLDDADPPEPTEEPPLPDAAEPPSDTGAPPSPDAGEPPPSDAGEPPPPESGEPPSADPGEPPSSDAGDSHPLGEGVSPPTGEPGPGGAWEPAY